MKKTATAGKARTPAKPKQSSAEIRDDSTSNGDQWSLRLYIAGQTAKSVAALANLDAFCKEHLKGLYTIEVIDLMKEPWHARSDQIIAIPTLIRRMPVPVRKIIGDLSNKERVLVGFDLHRAGGKAAFKTSP